MRKTLFLLIIVVMSVALAAAQHTPSMPSTDQSNPSTGGRSMGSSPDSQSTAPGQATSPAAPSSGATAPAGDSKIIEGCLGGSAPNFTVTDKAGTKYNLDIPKDADTAPLTAHLGQAVKVKGAVSGDKASAGASPTIQVEQMARGTSSCPAGANSPSSSNPPSSK